MPYQHYDGISHVAVNVGIVIFHILVQHLDIVLKILYHVVMDVQ